MKLKDKYKAEIVTSHNQYMYKRMSQKLKNTSHTYVQFTDLIFKSIFRMNEKARFIILINDHENAAMTSFINDHIISAVNFNKML